MFGRIVPRYDLLNRVMSLGMDRRWRRAAVASVRPGGAIALDVGAGTGEMSLELIRRGASSVVAADFSPAMLGAAGRKIPDRRVAFVQADALQLPFQDEVFDVVTNAFVLRNLADLPAAFAEMARVLKPLGRLACLDMTQPPPTLFGTAYRVYFTRVVPMVAGVISGDFDAYRYLPQSLHDFPDAEAIAGLLSDTGFIQVRVRRFGGGALALHTGVKSG
jgi:demethylmenaquinone methyltransferase/2-methoxy-6-polyprenyl-1,4-benzoquinol methylase